MHRETVIYHNGKQEETDHGEGIEKYVCDGCTNNKGVENGMKCKNCKRQKDKEVEYRRKYIW